MDVEEHRPSTCGPTPSQGTMTVAGPEEKNQDQVSLTRVLLLSPRPKARQYPWATTATDGPMDRAEETRKTQRTS